MRRAALAAVALAAPLLAGCRSDEAFEVPFLAPAAPIVPVEGLESSELVGRAHGAVLSARGERPIEVLLLPGLKHAQHPVRGDVVALAGPARDGGFLYVVRDDERRLRLRRGSLAGEDRAVARLDRPVHALSIAADGARAALLCPFDKDDPRSRGHVLRELVEVEPATGALTATGVACWNWPPAWIDARRVALVTVDEKGAREVRVLDVPSRALGPVLAPGEAVLVEPGGAALVVAARDEDGHVALARVSLDGSPATPLPPRGVLTPLAVLADGLLVAWSAPTLGAPASVELGIFRPSVAVGTIKLHALDADLFATVEPSASPRRLWSAGGL